MIHQPLSPDGVRPAYSSYITVCLFFVKELISFMPPPPLDKCHTSVFNALINIQIMLMIFPFCFCQQEKMLMLIFWKLDISIA